MESVEIPDWKANEELLSILIDMGIPKIAAEQALFFTGNNSVEAAATFVFDNPDVFQTDEMTDALKLSVAKEAKREKKEGRGEGQSSAEESSSDDEQGDGDVCKMVFVVNMSLKMGVGKLAAQVAHASLGLYRSLTLSPNVDDQVQKWIYYGEKKIVLKGDNHLQLIELQKQSEQKGLSSYLVKDAGKTQIAPGSITVLSIFGLEAQVNEVTGSLSLL